MSIIRLFIDQHISEGAIIILDFKQIHYLREVMRSKDGQNITIFSERDGEWQTVVEASYKSSITLKVIKCLRQPIIEDDFCLCFALVKWKALSNLIRQATELGVTKLQPVITDYTIVRTMSLNKLQSCIIEAAEQSGRLSTPKIMPLTTFYDMCEQYKEDLVICDETNKYNDPWTLLPQMSSITLMIGPEGGFSPHELEYSQIKRMSLGKEILRVDTAVVTAIIYVKALLGRQLT